MDFIRFLLIFLVPGIIGAIAYSITYRLKTEISPYVAMVFNLLTFTTMISGLYFFRHVNTFTDILTNFGNLCFTRNYILMSIWINICYGVIFGLLRRCFFWIRK